MPYNVTDLTERLLGALDDNYNAVNMPEIIEVISVLEKVAITKELLETTRLGKHLNELRRRVSNTELSKRLKELLKKWRTMVLPGENGQQNKVSPALQPRPKIIPPPIQHQQQFPPHQLPTTMGKSKISPILPVQTKVSPGLQKSRLVDGSNKMVSPAAVAQIVSSQAPQKRISPDLYNPYIDSNLNQLEVNRKRPANDSMDLITPKRQRLNGGFTDIKMSENYNSNFKDAKLPSPIRSEQKSDVILINSDSNSSFSEKTVETQNELNQPKKRGRKKGSKNHKSLIDDAEISFTSKLAVSASRGNSKVKTTQELLASIQNKNSIILKPKEDLEEKAAKLTERVSMIDKKLNANAQRSRNLQKNKLNFNNRNERIIESGSVINDRSLYDRIKNETSRNNADYNNDDGDEEDDEEVVVVDDFDSEVKANDSKDEGAAIKNEESNIVRGSLSVEEALALLPPIDKSVLETDDSEPQCTCRLIENKSDFSIDGVDIEERPRFEMIEDPECPAKKHLQEEYNTLDVSDEKIRRVLISYIPNVNGNYGLGPPKPKPAMVNGLYVNVVPSIYEVLDKDVKLFSSETFKKYSVSKNEHNSDNNDNSDSCSSNSKIVINNNNLSKDIKLEQNDDEKIENINSDTRTGNQQSNDTVFREWYECVELSGDNGEITRILPYSIVD